MKKGQKAVVWFNEVTKKDIPLVGGKGANLGEMTNAGIPVPPGFIVTAAAYFDFIEKSDLHDKIKALLDPIDVHDSKQLQEIAEKVQTLVKEAQMPAETAKEIEQAYAKMGRGLVAVRSSATAEDLPEASFAGQQATFLNIQGEKDVVRAVQDCWASLFGARAIFYRQEQGFEHFKVGIAVPVQRMVQSESSGVMFTIEPSTNNKERITIEAVLGLGEMIVSGDVTPDHYTVNKKDTKILEKEIKKQEWKLVKKAGAHGKADNIKIDLTPDEQA
ncbi:MAG TPA: PEP/pyruvate-binding domain-containing protein, partial [Dehalococcoidales bacterium]|nr:PEP/pyruvate-binding domain-containing protein [Dehalococcoidales bacterium]